MSPPPEAWDEADDDDDYECESLDEDFDLEMESSDRESDHVVPHLWPDPFDAGTEASSIPSARSSLPTSPLSSSRQISAADPQAKEACQVSGAFPPELHTVGLEEQFREDSDPAPEQDVAGLLPVGSKMMLLPLRPHQMCAAPDAVQIPESAEAKWPTPSLQAVSRNLWDTAEILNEDDVPDFEMAPGEFPSPEEYLMSFDKKVVSLSLPPQPSVARVLMCSVPDSDNVSQSQGCWAPETRPLPAKDCASGNEECADADPPLQHLMLFGSKAIFIPMVPEGMESVVSLSPDSAVTVDADLVDGDVQDDIPCLEEHSDDLEAHLCDHDSCTVEDLQDRALVEDDREDDEDDEEGLFFISAGGALEPVPEEESCDASLDEQGLSAPLRAYVAATGALVTPPASHLLTEHDAAMIIQKVFRGEQARKQFRELERLAELPASEEEISRCSSRADEVGCALDASVGDESLPACEEEEEEIAPTQTQSNSVEAAHSVEDVLRAQILAKQVLMPVVLQAVFAVQAIEAAQHSQNEQQIIQESDEVDEVASQPAEPCLEQDEMLTTPSSEVAPLNIENEAAPLNTEDACAIASPVQDLDSNEAAMPVEPVPKQQAVPVEHEGRRPSNKATEKSSASGAQAAKHVPGPRFISASTIPRQPLPRPEKRPPVPRAPRGASKQMLKINCEKEATAAVQAEESVTAAVQSDTVENQEKSSAPCCEVSEEEFQQLLQRGALQVPCSTSEAGTSQECYEITDEEFQQLMQAGQLHPVPEENATAIDVGFGVQLPMAYSDVSDEQFEQLMMAGALQLESNSSQLAAAVTKTSDVAESVCPSSPRTPSESCSSEANPTRTKVSAKQHCEKERSRPSSSRSKPSSAKASSRPKRRGSSPGVDLFFLPTDGIPKVQGLGEAQAFVSSAEAHSVRSIQSARSQSARSQSARSQSARSLQSECSNHSARSGDGSGCSSPIPEVMPSVLPEESEQDAEDLQEWQDHIVQNAAGRAAVAGSPRNSAFFLRELRATPPAMPARSVSSPAGSLNDAPQALEGLQTFTQLAPSRYSGIPRPPVVARLPRLVLGGPKVPRVSAGKADTTFKTGMTTAPSLIAPEDWVESHNMSLSDEVAAWSGSAPGSVRRCHVVGKRGNSLGAPRKLAPLAG